jgi:hypothetical protein
VVGLIRGWEVGGGLVVGWCWVGVGFVVGSWRRVGRAGVCWWLKGWVDRFLIVRMDGFQVESR